jgi:hypothetical protein
MGTMILMMKSVIKPKNMTHSKENMILYSRSHKTGELR